MRYDGDDDEVQNGGDADSGTGGQATEGPGTEQGAADEGDDASEHVDDQEDDGEQEVDEAPARSRGESRIQRLANETKAAREEAAEARREAQELRRQQFQGQTQLTEQQERERLALMTPEERSDYRIDRMQRSTQQQINNVLLQTQMTADKTSYAAKASVNQVYARHEAEVEKRFNEQVQQGKPVERELILKVLLGERALNGGGARQAKAKKAGAERVAAQQVKGGSPRGDAASQRAKVGATAESRLKDQYI